MSVSRMVFLLLATAAIAGCGGGGGGGGSSSSSLSLSETRVAFEAFAAGDASESRSIGVSWSDSRVAGFAVGTLPGQSLPSWLAVDASSQTQSGTITLTRTAQPLAAGSYATTIRILSGDANLNVLGQADIAVLLEVVPVPVVGAPPTVVWVETLQPATQTLSITGDSRVQVDGVSDDLDWMDASAAGDLITLAATPGSASLPPGELAGVLQTTFRLGSRQRVVSTPVTGRVQGGLVPPGPLHFEINASSSAASLTRLATVTARTPAEVGFTVQSSAPWLAATGFVTGAPDNLALALSAVDLASRPPGSYEALITVTPTTAGLSSVTIPVTLEMRLPEVHFVAPVAYTSTVASETLIIRGAGLDDPGVQVLMDGEPLPGVSVISDTELRVMPGPRAAGSFAVTVPNLLGITREPGTFRVVETPVYAGFTFEATVGLQERVMASPVNRAVYAHRCWFCTVSVVQPGTLSVIQRFARDPGSGAWTRTTHPYPSLWDFTLSTDETLLIVLTATDLLLVDPVTMQTLETHALPGEMSGIARQMAALNHGLVIIEALRTAFSLRTKAFVPLPELGRGLDGGISASRNGSRALVADTFTFNTWPDVAVAYFDASTDTVVTSGTVLPRDTRPVYGFRADVALYGRALLNADLGIRGTFAHDTWSVGEIAPDGSRGYGLDYNARLLRVVDATGAQPYPEVAAIPVAGIGGASGGAGRLAVDPSGAAVFVVAETQFTVVPAP